MIRKTIVLTCALIAPLAIAQTTITRETTITTQTEVMRLDSTHLMTVNSIAPGDKISVQTSPDTQPVTVRLDRAIAYVDANGQPISPSSIQPGSRVRLEFSGPGPDRLITRVILVNP
jgi:hypothetical protein